MSDSQPDQPKQKTAKGHEVPVPKRRDFDPVLNAVAKPLMQLSRVRRAKK